MPCDGSVLPPPMLVTVNTSAFSDPDSVQGVVHWCRYGHSKRVQHFVTGCSSR